MAGLKPSQMRVASPFNDSAKDSLNLYRVIDPEIWTRLVGRVQGLISALSTVKPRPWLIGSLSAGGTYLGILHEISAGYASGAAAEKLCEEVSDVHRFLAQRGRRTGRGDDSGAAGSRLPDPAQRCFQLYRDEEFPGGVSGADSDDTDDIRTTRAFPAGSACVTVFLKTIIPAVSWALT